MNSPFAATTRSRIRIRADCWGFMRMCSSQRQESPSLTPSPVGNVHPTTSVGNPHPNFSRGLDRPTRNVALMRRIHLGARVFSVCVAPHAWHAFVASAFRPTPRIEAQARHHAGWTLQKTKPRCNTGVSSSTGFSLCAVSSYRNPNIPLPDARATGPAPPFTDRKKRPARVLSLFLTPRYNLRGRCEISSRR